MGTVSHPEAGFHLPPFGPTLFLCPHDSSPLNTPHVVYLVRGVRLVLAGPESREEGNSGVRMEDVCGTGECVVCVVGLMWTRTCRCV